jgi:hypothetical protein
MPRTNYNLGNAIIPSNRSVLSALMDLMPSKSGDIKIELRDACYKSSFRRGHATIAS